MHLFKKMCDYYGHIHHHKNMASVGVNVLIDYADFIYEYVICSHHVYKNV